MRLGGCRVGAAIPVSDMARAREFYETRLGLTPATDHEPENNVTYLCGGGTVVHVFTTPHAGTSRATVAGWEVDDIERIVDELTADGVVFEQYDGAVNGIMDIEGNYPSKGRGERAAWFRDSEGNMLGIAEVVR